MVIFFLSGNNRTLSPIALPVEEMAQTLQDLIKYFQPPGEDLEHEDKQNKLRSLKNRQNLFKDEVERDYITLMLCMYSCSEQSKHSHLYTCDI